MCGWSSAGMMGAMTLGMALWGLLGLLLVGVLFWGIWLLVSHQRMRPVMLSPTMMRPVAPYSSALPASALSHVQVLRERYARGEIDLDTLRTELARLDDRELLTES